ncbi:retrovirus-related Pol polyprotein from transposon opus [Trichonephila clavipes]|nr:retrovirus-related Pol polyprotein from transposon opus [Trichonephila clavipes]
MDLIGPIDPPSSKGHKYILCLVDQHTRWGEAVPLTSLSAKVACEAFVKLKELPCEVTSLATPDANLPFQVHCDASDYGVGCCLIQQDTEGIYRPIAFASQKFNATQKNWASIEKEAWAVLYGLNKFDKWIYGAKVEIISDHNPLKYLNQTTPKSPKLTRWALALQRWNHPITHRPDAEDEIFIPALQEYDQGTSFTSALNTEFFERFRILVRHSFMYHPQSNPVERFHRTLKRLLRLDAGSEWDKYLPSILLLLWTVSHESTRYTPSEMVYGKNFRTPETLAMEHWVEPKEESDLVTEYMFKLINRLKICQEVAINKMEEMQDNRKTWYDKNAVKREFKDGDLVLLLATSRANKLAVQWIGPGTILNKISETNYLVEIPGRQETSQIYHINMLKPYHKRPEHVNGFRTPSKIKVQAVLEFPTPRTKTKIRAFLGSAGYYEKYINLFSVIAAPLTDALKGRAKTGEIKRTTEGEDAFRELKGKVTDKPVLYALIFEREFIVQTDASNAGMGAVLTQLNEQAIGVFGGTDTHTCNLQLQRNPFLTPEESNPVDRKMKERCFELTRERRPDDSSSHKILDSNNL